MPLVKVLNLRGEDPLAAIEEAVRGAMTSLPALEIRGDEVDVVPMRAPDDDLATVARIDVDLWEGPARTKAGLQELAANVARAFQSVVGQDRKVKVVIQPYDIGTSGWVSF